MKHDLIFPVKIITVQLYVIDTTSSSYKKKLFLALRIKIKIKKY